MLLPDHYLQPTHMQKVQAHRRAGVRFADEWDFKAYNQTRFAGLENGIANCYANPLVQVGLLDVPQGLAALLARTVLCPAVSWFAGGTRPLLLTIGGLHAVA